MLLNQLTELPWNSTPTNNLLTEENIETTVVCFYHKIIHITIETCVHFLRKNRGRARIY
jgi:hypothetical protein